VNEQKELTLLFEEQYLPHRPPPFRPCQVLQLLTQPSLGVPPLPPDQRPQVRERRMERDRSPSRLHRLRRPLHTPRTSNNRLRRLLRRQVRRRCQNRLNHRFRFPLLPPPLPLHRRRNHHRLDLRRLPSLRPIRFPWRSLHHRRSRRRSRRTFVRFRIDDHVKERLHLCVRSLDAALHSRWMARIRPRSATGKLRLRALPVVPFFARASQ
jgi:hypothetical protein